LAPTAFVWGLLLVVCACGDGAGPVALRETAVLVETTNLRALDPTTEGSYEAWVTGQDGSIRSAGRFTPSASGTVTVKSPIESPARLSITLELPGDSDSEPSPHDIIGGVFDNGVASLSIRRHVTGVSDFESDPGHHALFTPSNNPEFSFPSREDSGIWVFAPSPSQTKHNNHFLRLTPLRAGWIYEGWIVYEYGTANECWVSYGKFLPDNFSEANSRDDTGLGVFSGQQDYVNALPFDVDMPGDDWVDNIHGLPVPCGLTLPFDLNGDIDDGILSPWTHVITVEPISDRGEGPLEERPFLIQPYRNPFGEGPPNEGRPVLLNPDRIPSGTATIQN